MGDAKSLFVVIRRYGGPFDPRKPLEMQPEWEAHRAFMNVLETSGMSRLGGPLEETGEVLLVFRATTAAEIDACLKDDPWTRSGILSTVRIARWDLRIGGVA